MTMPDAVNVVLIAGGLVSIAVMSFILTVGVLREFDLPRSSEQTRLSRPV
jgi:hypothetical protein